MIKRALEEWRRQRNSGVQASSSLGSTGGYVPSVALAARALTADFAVRIAIARGSSALEGKLNVQEEEIAKLMEEARIKVRANSFKRVCSVFNVDLMSCVLRSRTIALPSTTSGTRR
jgi:hypothetical protein